MSDIEQRVKKIVAEQLGVNESEIKNESSFVDDLGADSLDTVELIMAFEEEFKEELGGEIPESEAEKLTSVGEVIAYIEAKAASPDVLLFWPVGDLYELYAEDAEIASKAIGLAITTRNGVQTCGVPAARLLECEAALRSAGHRVARIAPEAVG